MLDVFHIGSLLLPSIDIHAISETENEVGHLLVKILLYFLSDVVQIDCEHLVHVHPVLLLIPNGVIVSLKVLIVVRVYKLHLGMHLLFEPLIGVLLFPLHDLHKVLVDVAPPGLLRPHPVILCVSILKPLNWVGLSLPL